MFEPGHHIDKYVIEQAIAAGGMGIVYRARHAHLGTPVALKMLLPNLAVRSHAVLPTRSQPSLPVDRLGSRPPTFPIPTRSR